MYWGKAKVIDILTKLNIYVLNPRFSAEQFYFPFISREFSEEFSLFNLADVLESCTIVSHANY